MMTLEKIVPKLRHAVCRTDGKGWWSDSRRNVRIQSVEVQRKAPNQWFPNGEIFLLVKFDPKTWDIDKHGLIYTDAGWIRDFRRALAAAGYDHADKVNYTEQGMQGRTYVHLIVGRW